MALPHHPGQDDEAVENAPSRRTQLLIAAGVLLLIVMIVLHLTGVLGP
jgi:hypothetical protein